VSSDRSDPTGPSGSSGPSGAHARPGPERPLTPADGAGAAGDDHPDADLRRIAERIRRWREESDLTLQELARRSGVATSTIHKIETAQMVPSVAVVLKVARGLGRRPADLVREGEEALDAVHLRAGERQPVGVRGRQVLERLSGDLPDPALETWRATVHPGHGSGDIPLSWDGEALVVCEAGEVTFTLGGREHVLAAGDTLHFKADVPHRWHNRGEEPARFTLTGTLPRAFRAALREPLHAEPVAARRPSGA